MGGADQFETAKNRGVAAITAAMMSEGTKTRDGEALSNALQLLGTSVQVSVGSESGSMGFMSTSGKFGQTLDILADMLLNPVFPAPALERIRGQRLVALTSAKAQPGAIAGRVFPKIVYGTGHPFGQLVTEETLKAITRDEVAAFHKAYFQAGRAAIVVVGDVTPAAAKATVEKALAAWPAGGSKPAFSYPAVPPQKPTTIYLVDKPGAAQSTFAIGLPGPPRKTPDYYAIEVMNTLLGGMFQSRLNANIREEKGLSYGISSRFAFGKGPGAFRAGGDIISAKSDVGLTEFMKEFRGIQGSRPVTDDEIQMSKNSLAQSLPGMFASVSSIGRRDRHAVDAGAAGGLLPAVREEHQRGDEGRHGARGEAVHRPRAPVDRDRGRQGDDRGAAQGHQHRADRRAGHRGQRGQVEHDSRESRVKGGVESQSTVEGRESGNGQESRARQRSRVESQATVEESRVRQRSRVESQATVKSREPGNGQESRVRQRSRVESQATVESRESGDGQERESQATVKSRESGNGQESRASHARESTFDC